VLLRFPATLFRQATSTIPTTPPDCCIIHTQELFKHSLFGNSLKPRSQVCSCTFHRLSGSVSIHTSLRCQHIAQYDNFVRDGNFLHHVLCSVPGFWSSYHVLFGACDSSNAFSRPASPYPSDPDSLRKRRITHRHSAHSQVITIYSRVRSCDIR
jgi:hypothetical protein